MSVQVRSMQERLEITPGNLRKVLERKEEILALVKDIKISADTRIFMVANGSSGEGLVIATFLWERILGIKPYFVGPYQFNHYPTQLRPNDIVLSLSQTGTSKEVVNALRLAKKQGAQTIGLTTIADTPITKTADVVVLLPEGVESISYKVVGVVVNMLAVMLVAYGIARANDMEVDIKNDMEALQQAIDRYPTTEVVVKQWVSDNFDFLEAASGLTVVGSGPMLEVAEELAIKTSEVINIQTCHIDLEEYMHGLCAILDPAHVLVMVVGNDNWEYAIDVYEACKKFGKKIVWLGPKAPEGQIDLIISDDPVYATFDGMAAVHSFVIKWGELGNYGEEGTKVFDFYQEQLKVRE